MTRSAEAFQIIQRQKRGCGMMKGTAGHFVSPAAGAGRDGGHPILVGAASPSVFETAGPTAISPIMSETVLACLRLFNSKPSNKK